MSCQIQFVNSYDYYQAHGFSRLDQQGINLLLVENAEYRLLISLQGGQLLQCYRKADQHELLWLSPLNSFKANTAIRGGVPICFPWFGVNQANPGASKHGFVRNQDWQLTNISSEPDSLCIELFFQQVDQPGNPADFPYPFILLQKISCNDKGLRMELALENQSTSSWPLSWAWHSYFNVESLNDVAITGLEQQDYLDNCQGLSVQQQSGALRFNGEVDRVFQPGVESSQSITTAACKRVDINSSAPSCIVWNPGAELGSQMSDVGAGYRHFVCLERGAAFEQALNLAPGQSYQAWIQIAFS